MQIGREEFCGDNGEAEVSGMYLFLFLFLVDEGSKMGKDMACDERLGSRGEVMVDKPKADH